MEGEEIVAGGKVGVVLMASKKSSSFISPLPFSECAGIFVLIKLEEEEDEGGKWVGEINPE